MEVSPEGDDEGGIGGSGSSGADDDLLADEPDDNDLDVPAGELEGMLEALLVEDGILPPASGSAGSGSGGLPTVDPDEEAFHGGLPEAQPQRPM